MNEKIKVLAEQAGFIDRGTNHTAYMNFDHEKFAELLVQNCITLCEEIGTKQDGQYCADKIKESFSENSN